VIERAFTGAGRSLFCWRAGRTLEDELFLSLSDRAVAQILERAVTLYDQDKINANIASASNGQSNLAACRAAITPTTRQILAAAARSGEWFKSVTKMEEVTRDIIGPDLANAEAEFNTIIATIIRWIFRAY